MHKRHINIKTFCIFLLALFLLAVGYSSLRNASYFAAVFWVGTSVFIAFKQYKSINGGLSDPSAAKKMSVVENSLVTILLTPFAIVLFGASYLVGIKASSLGDYIVVIVLVILGLATGSVIYRNWLPKR